MKRESYEHLYEWILQIKKRSGDFFSKKKAAKKTSCGELESENLQGFLKEQHEEQRRMAVIEIDREIKRQMYGH